MALWVKDLMSQLWCRLQLQHGANPWPGNFHMPWVQTKKKNVLWDIENVHPYNGILLGNLFVFAYLLIYFGPWPASGLTWELSSQTRV